MTLIQAALVTFVETNLPSAGKGFPVLVPQDEPLPAWAYQRIPISGELLSHGGPTGLVTDRIQITVQAAETTGKSAYQNVVTTADLIRAAIDGYQGLMGDVPVDYCHVRSIQDDWAAQRELPVARLDITIQYRRT
jgi:hypothetical protein